MRMVCRIGFLNLSVGMVAIPKDRFGKMHPPVCQHGYRVKGLKCWERGKAVGRVSLDKPLVGDVWLGVKYLRSYLVEVRFVFDVGGRLYPLFSLRYSCCFACGEMIAFGVVFDVCWLCKDESEDLEDF